MSERGGTTREVWGHNNAVAIAWRNERANLARVERSEWSRLSGPYPNDRRE